MSLFLVAQDGVLVPHHGELILVELDNGRVLRLEQGPDMPSEGLDIWGEFTIKPIGCNCVSITPWRDNMGRASGITKLMILDEHSHRHPTNGYNVVIGLNNGKTLEVEVRKALQEEDCLFIWGGREPRPQQSLEEWQENTENLSIFPRAGNLVTIFPFREGST